MSRIGIGNNLHTPNAECLKCKYWKPAEKDPFFSGLTTIGRCSTGYCKQKAKLRNRKVK